MAEVRLYLGIENIALTNPQRQQLITHLQSLGLQNNSPFPHLRNHGRIRPDEDAAFFEAAFDDGTISIQAVKNRLGIIFSIDPAQISHNVNTVSYSTGNNTTVVTFTYQAQARLRTAAFGTLSGTWAQSNAEVRGYLAANAEAWGEE